VVQASAHSSPEILTLSNTQAKALAGRYVGIGGTTYYFQGYDKRQPGQPPWRSGAEGKAYPLLDINGTPAAYLKFFTHPTQKRLDRTAWLIGQQMHNWLPHLAAAPVLWTDTRQGLRGAKIDFEFAAYLAKAVPGQTWLELKGCIASGATQFPDAFRWRCAKDLLLALAALERAGLVHGDLSPNNVVVDLEARPNEPALYLIDFDAFFAPAAGENASVTVEEGGTYGTDGYCPPNLAEMANRGDVSAAPYSDRFGRDMLLLEFLLMKRNLPADDPLAQWNRQQLERRFAVWQACGDPQATDALRHLDLAAVFTLNEDQRPTSVELAAGLGQPPPERRFLRRVTDLPQPTPANLGRPPTREDMEWISRKSAAGKKAQRLTRLGGAVQVDYGPPDETQPQRKSGDDDLSSFLAILAGIALLLAFFALLAAIAHADRDTNAPTNATAPQDPGQGHSILELDGRTGN
jgi:hypothetical protein